MPLGLVSSRRGARSSSYEGREQMAGAAWAMEKLYKDREAAGQVGRVLEVVEMRGADSGPVCASDPLLCCRLVGRC